MMDQNGKSSQLWQWPKLAKTPPQNLECWKKNHLPHEIVVIVWSVATVLLGHLWNKKKVQHALPEDPSKEGKVVTKQSAGKENDEISLLENTNCGSVGSTSTIGAELTKESTQKIEDPHES